MQLWFKRILERNDSAMENDDGLLVTAVPEDIFSLIKTQAELAGEHLKDYALCDAIRVDELQRVNGRFVHQRSRHTRNIISRTLLTTLIVISVH